MLVLGHLSLYTDEQCGRQIGLVLLHCANHGEVPPQEPLSQLVGSEEIATRDIATAPKSLHDDPHALILLRRASTDGLAGVDLYLPRVAGFGIADHPLLDPVFCWLAGHVLAR